MSVDMPRFAFVVISSVGTRIGINVWRRTAMRRLMTLCISLAFVLVLSARAQDSVGQIEPNAGSWKTWAISSGKDFRVPPPPDAAATVTELAWLKTFSQEKDPSIAEQVRFWNAGPPSYRWVDVVTNRL